MEQLDIFAGESLKQQGIHQSLSNANLECDGWSDMAFSFLERFIQSHKEFMVEEVRVASKGIVPEPPSKRAWGGVVLRASNQDLIEKAGFRAVKNPLAHRTPATLWRVV